jgi:hypothetical protein
MGNILGASKGVSIYKWWTTVIIVDKKKKKTQHTVFSYYPMQCAEFQWKKPSKNQSGQS